MAVSKFGTRVRPLDSTGLIGVVVGVSAEREVLLGDSSFGAGLLPPGTLNSGPLTEPPLPWSEPSTLATVPRKTVLEESELRKVLTAPVVVAPATVTPDVLAEAPSRFALPPTLRPLTPPLPPEMPLARPIEALFVLLELLLT